MGSMRFYLLTIVVVGLLGSMLSHLPSRQGQSPHALYVNAAGAEETDAAPRADASPQPMDGSVELQRNENGHFYADVEINGAQVHMLVDTGATGIALSREDARKAGIATSIGMNDVVGEGADGSIHGEYVTIDRMSLGGKTVEGMHAIVLNNGEQSLLGQAFLAQFASVEMHGNVMTLR
jgi:aspartyl protease family protein